MPLVYAWIATAAPKLRADSRYFLAHAGLTRSNPPSFSRAERENRPRAHRSIMLVYNFTSYFALLPLDFVDKLFDRRARLNSLRCEAL